MYFEVQGMEETQIFLMDAKCKKLMQSALEFERRNRTEVKRKKETGLHLYS